MLYSVWQRNLMLLMRENVGIDELVNIKVGGLGCCWLLPSLLGGASIHSGVFFLFLYIIDYCCPIFVCNWLHKEPNLFISFCFNYLFFLGGFFFFTPPACANFIYSFLALELHFLNILNF